MLSAVAFTAPHAALAGVYLVSPKATTPGAVIEYGGKQYTVGTTAFTSAKDVMAIPPAAKSTVNFAPGTYADAFTVSVDGLKLMGSNTYQDPRAETRKNPSIITARITVNANSVEINGFNFNGEGSVYNNAATRTAPMSGLVYQYNVAENLTIARATNTAFIRLGKIASDATANDAASRCRYADIKIQHNLFKGAAAPVFIQLAGASGTTTVADNKFSSGATSIRMDNVIGTVNVKFNKFMEVGSETKDLGGDFCVQINRSAAEGTTEFNIMHNDFRNCVGQTSLYPLIRFYPGKAGEADQVSPVNCSMNINYNVFRGKEQVHADYNYVYYADKGTSGAVRSDFSGNVFDNTQYQFAFGNRPGQTDLQRFYATAYGPVDPKNCTFGTFKTATALTESSVLQSFDYDPVLGDIYYIQVSYAGTVSGDPKPLMITRLKADGTTSKMKLVWAGHGTNMAVANIGGKPYIFTGGKATMKSDGSETRADACCWFRYVGGATADLRNDSFTHSGTTYPIKTYDRASKNNEYPAVDEVSRLFCSRTTGTNVNYFAIFNLDDMLTDPSTAKALSTCTINKGDNPTSTSGDKGYNTWDHQGYTIHGDYLYILEGVGTESATALNGKPTLWLHVYDWRRKQFVIRRQLTNSTINGLTHGEPEGIKVRLNSDGHAEILVGVAVGSSGARKATIYKYTPKAATFALSNAKHVTDVSRLDLTTTTGNPVTGTVVVTNTNLHGGVTTPVSGSKQFTAEKSKASAWHPETTVTVTYNPVADMQKHSGYLRVSSPMAVDVIVPVTGTNSTATGVADIAIDPAGHCSVSTEGMTATVTGLTALSSELYTLDGRLVATALGSEVTAPAHGIYILKATTLGNHRYTFKVAL